MNLYCWLIERIDGHRRIDAVLNVLGSNDFNVDGETPREHTIAGHSNPEMWSRIVSRLEESIPGFWNGFSKVRPPIEAPIDPATYVLLNDINVALLTTGCECLPNQSQREIDGGALQDLLNYLLTVIY